MYLVRSRTKYSVELYHRALLLYRYTYRSDMFPSGLGSLECQHIDAYRMSGTNVSCVSFADAVLY